MKGGDFGAEEDDEEIDPEAPQVTEGERKGMKYHHIVFKAHYEEKCTEANHKPGAPSYPDGCLLSTWRLPWREIKTIMAQSEARFEVIYQQQDSATSEVLVPKAWIYGDSSHFGCLDDTRNVLEVPKGLTNLFSVVTIDPSPTQLWGITWWLYHPETEQRFLFDLENRKMDASDLLDFNYNDNVFYGLMEEWQATSRSLGVPISHWVVEINAAQRFLLQYQHTRRWCGVNGHRDHPPLDAAATRSTTTSGSGPSGTTTSSPGSDSPGSPTRRARRSPCASSTSWYATRQEGRATWSWPTGFSSGSCRGSGPPSAPTPHSRGRRGCSRARDPAPAAGRPRRVEGPAALRSRDGRPVQRALRRDGARMSDLAELTEEEYVDIIARALQLAVSRDMD